jgi:hypothetical protein
LKQLVPGRVAASWAFRPKFGSSETERIEGLPLEWQVIHFVAGEKAASGRVFVVVHVPVAGQKEEPELLDRPERPGVEADGHTMTAGLLAVT